MTHPHPPKTPQQRNEREPPNHFPKHNFPQINNTYLQQVSLPTVVDQQQSNCHFQLHHSGEREKNTSTFKRIHRSPSLTLYHLPSTWLNPSCNVHPSHTMCCIITCVPALAIAYHQGATLHTHTGTSCALQTKHLVT